MAAANVSSGATDSPNETAAVNPKLRKRTKTGCLTCRKRRIKCGEERPTCNNCIKSKRHCEGYNQRVVFKPPIGDWPGVHHGSSTLQYHNGLLPGTQPALQRPVPPPIHTQDPSGVQLYQMPAYGNSNEHGQALPLSATSFVAATAYQTQQQATPLPSPFAVPSSFTPIGPSHFRPIFSVQVYGQGPIAISGHTWPQQPMQTPPNLHQQSSFEISPNLEFTSQQPPTPASTLQDFKPVLTEPSLLTPVSTTTLQASATLKREDDAPTWPPSSDTTVTGDDLGPNPFLAHEQASSQPPTGIPHPGLPSQGFPTIQTPVSSSTTIDPMLQPIFWHIELGPTQGLEDAAIESMDDDYYDVQSEEEMDLAPSQAAIKAYETDHDFSMMLALQRESMNELSMRRYDNFLYDGILGHYRPEWAASPLKNPNTARVFMHFITATGPTLSIYERFPRNTSALFEEWYPSTPPQGLWTYLMPLMALNHQGLLHAMLAMASLHIAKLLGASKTPSVKHYIYAIKRVNRCLGNPKKKLLPTTLAATLLLAFYEVMTAEHVKWCSHLSGARSLIARIDYLSMSKEARRLREEAAGLRSQYSHSDMTLQREHYSPTEDAHHSIDENIVSAFFGKKLKYDEFGRVIDDLSNSKRRNSLPESFDLSRFELYQDLFWWYAKQDCFQSIISGNPLLLDYNRWADCPPRASFGRSDAIYGTFDHLLLLLGRLADFTARDRLRKIKVIDANGGQWRPQPGMNLGSPPVPPSSRNAHPTNAQHPQNLAPQTGSRASTQTQPSQPPLQQPNPSKPPQMPSFYGMAPSPTTVHTPSAYARNTSSSPDNSPKPTESETDLNAATASALEEWQRIRTALDLFAQNLGPAFQPVPTECHSQPTNSPFGGVVQYRRYDIANIWAHYYMCNIILLRAHPHMPPAAMVAAGVAAPQTAHYANLIGQIAAGIVSPRAQPWNPSIGSCHCDICIPLFFAGVQFREPDQRSWLVTHVRDIEARTGWASLGMIAIGCETAWVKAWEAGRGPKYVRVLVDKGDGDERVTRKGGHLDPTSMPQDWSDRRFIHVNPSTRVHWAVGLLAEEQDLKRDAV